MMIFENKRGFTLMELVTSVAIMGTLAALAVPTYVEIGAQAKGTKSLDNITIIGSAVLHAYSEVASEGYNDGTDVNAIAEFNFDTYGAQEQAIVSTQTVITYGNGSSTGEIIQWSNIFPDGTPVSPFDKSAYNFQIIAAGSGSWDLSTGIPTLIVNPKPSIKIIDPAHPTINKTFTP